MTAMSSSCHLQVMCVSAYRTAGHASERASPGRSRAEDLAADVIEGDETGIRAARERRAQRNQVGPRVGPDPQKSREIACTTVAVSETSSPNA